MNIHKLNVNFLLELLFYFIFLSMDLCCANLDLYLNLQEVKRLLGEFIFLCYFRL